MISQDVPLTRVVDGKMSRVGSITVAWAIASDGSGDFKVVIETVGKFTVAADAHHAAERLRDMATNLDQLARTLEAPAPVPGDDRPMLSPKDAARRLNTSVDTVYKLKIPGFKKIGRGKGVLRIPEKDLEAYIQKGGNKR